VTTVVDRRGGAHKTHASSQRKSRTSSFMISRRCLIATVPTPTFHTSRAAGVELLFVPAGSQLDEVPSKCRLNSPEAPSNTHANSWHRRERRASTMDRRERSPHDRRCRIGQNESADAGTPCRWRSAVVSTPLERKYSQKAVQVESLKQQAARQWSREPRLRPSRRAAQSPSKRSTL
jgi:hypothetical protein